MNPGAPDGRDPVAGGSPDPVETDTPVETESIEAPPVTVATVDRPNGPRRIGGRIAGVLGFFAVLAIGGAVYVGYTLSQDRSTTEATLATAEGDLRSTNAAIDTTVSTIAATETQLADRTVEREARRAEIADLSAQVATQTECVRLQEAALAELLRISDLQSVNFNRTAEGSTWASAEAKRGDNIDAALDAFYGAYTAAFQGSTGAAEVEANRGKAAQASIAEADAEQVTELKLVDEKAAEIQAAIDALEQQLAETESVCEAVAP